MNDFQSSVFTRVSDLDTQRHVTSRTYEAFALQGRHDFLESVGLGIPVMLDQDIFLKPEKNYVKFYRQQQPKSELMVETRAYASNGKILWDQKILEVEGSLACHLQTLTNCPVWVEEQLLPIDSAIEIHYSDLPQFSGSCRQVIHDYNMLFTERDIFGQYNVASIWRIFEEGRWLFTSQVGLTLKKIIEMDTTSFYMGGVCNFFEFPAAGTKVQVHSWIDRVDKIRFFFRQDVKQDGKLLFSMKDEQLIVSLSKARPRKVPEDFLMMIGDYVEHR